MMDDRQVKSKIIRGRKSNRVTQWDIARKLGVTQAAVALVLGTRGGTSRISAELTNKIRETALELNYRPHPGAQQLAGKGTGLVGILIRHLNDHFHSRPTQLIEREMSDRGYSTALGVAHGSTEKIHNYLEEFSMRGVEGLICLESVVWQDATLMNYLLETIPKTVFCSSHRNPELCIIDVDRVCAVRLAVRHLLERGRRRIGLATWADDYGISPSVMARHQGYQLELKLQGLDVDHNLIFATGEKAIADIPAQAIFDEIIERLVRGEHADAVIVYDDFWAIRLVTSLQRCGMRVPDDVAVIGMGNEPTAQIIFPAITTVEVHYDIMCQKAADRLEQRLKDIEIPVEQRLILVAPELIVRESS